MNIFKKINTIISNNLVFKLKTLIDRFYEIPVEFCSEKAKVEFFIEFKPENNVLSFITRSNGQPSYDKYSPHDYEAGEMLEKQINEKFPDIKTELYTVNEFVYVDCYLK